jgi:hypothetical protein
MRMLDVDREQGVRVLQLYLSSAEAEELHRHLGELIRNPEAIEHRHLFAEDMSRELSLSILTGSKRASAGYTRVERRIFDEP